MIAYILELVEGYESVVLGVYSSPDAAWECIEEGRRAWPFIVTGIEVDTNPSPAAIGFDHRDYPQVRWAEPIQPGGGVANCGTRATT